MMAPAVRRRRSATPSTSDRQNDRFADPIDGLDDCGHVPQFEHPERTHRLVREFLAETP